MNFRMQFHLSKVGISLTSQVPCLLLSLLLLLLSLLLLLLTNIAIRATYYIFCCRNTNWGSPDLMQFWFLFFIFFFLFFFLFSLFCFVSLNNPISSNICKLPIRSESYNCTFKNTNEVSSTVIIIIFFNVAWKNESEILFKLSNLNSNLTLNLGYLNPALNNLAQVACWLLRKRHETLRSNKCSISNPVPSVYLYSALVQLLSNLVVDEDITLVFREIYLFVHLFHFYIWYNIETSTVNIFAPTILISIWDPEH